jgi:hypothetical protein
MKLTNQEIGALVDTIRGTEKQKIEKFNEDLKKNPSKQDMANAKKYHKALISIPRAIRNEVNYRDDITEKQVLNAILSFKKKRYSGRTDELRSNVIIAAMECENIFQLKKKLGI